MKMIKKNKQVGVVVSIPCWVSPQSVPRVWRAGTPGPFPCLLLVSPALHGRQQLQMNRPPLALSACLEQLLSQESPCPAPGTGLPPGVQHQGFPPGWRPAKLTLWVLRPCDYKESVIHFIVENVFPLQCWCGPSVAGLFTCGFPRHLQSWAE